MQVWMTLVTHSDKRQIEKVGKMSRSTWDIHNEFARPSQAQALEAMRQWARLPAVFPWLPRHFVVVAAVASVARPGQ